ncbi:MAG: hypothetical protein A2998_01080 [Candidatus Staskawiczbacteria bacterium RIFCSPLOWO2_01_FULL_37_25b]|uniref:Uncharacterized protein n=2 Tax=Candidatus Staskawicziibacteriota TaxID=1817916 RepID=A0A1G2HKH3_9BACT|nr:MAG: hypothetical protein A2812_02555 [Candidatus Staskawiczbacteria bacterium RIFCSPHIGHO2_01_FULL_36_16]OGZ72013.1 MAG: hypothetical protein A2998_01080 [Candidatus Staskawiczbacteria bacterium RIFCSPLOWO2_01_FULL_37_25b]
MEKNKEEFIKSQIFSLTIMGGLSRGYPVYEKAVLETDKNNFKKFLEETLKSYGKLYEKEVEENEHIKNILKLKKVATEKFGKIFKDKKFRLGRAQKVLNLYLKYLWTLGRIPKPPHCPFDSVIISKLGKEVKNITWTKLDKEEDYKRLVEVARKISHDNIASWELEYWNNNLEKQNIL